MGFLQTLDGGNACCEGLLQFEWRPGYRKFAEDGQVNILLRRLGALASSVVCKKENLILKYSVVVWCAVKPTTLSGKQASIWRILGT